MKENDEFAFKAPSLKRLSDYIRPVMRLLFGSICAAIRFTYSQSYLNTLLVLFLQSLQSQIATFCKNFKQTEKHFHSVLFIYFQTKNVEITEYLHFLGIVPTRWNYFLFLIAFSSELLELFLV